MKEKFGSCNYQSGASQLKEIFMKVCSKNINQRDRGNF